MPFLSKIKFAWKQGWPWGLFMFLLLECIPMFKKGFDLPLLLQGALLWSIGSILIGFWIQFIQKRFGVESRKK